MMLPTQWEMGEVAREKQKKGWGDISALTTAAIVGEQEALVTNFIFWRWQLGKACYKMKLLLQRYPTCLYFGGKKWPKAGPANLGFGVQNGPKMVKNDPNAQNVFMLH